MAVSICLFKGVPAAVMFNPPFATIRSKALDGQWGVVNEKYWCLLYLTDLHIFIFLSILLELINPLPDD
jgi:hypothetical protein